MIKNRKKACCLDKDTIAVVVIDDHTEELQLQKIVSPTHSFNKLKPVSLKIVNPYEQIRQIPEVCLTKQDMLGDPVELIAKLQQKYWEFGAVKIKACPEWQPPFSFKYTEKGITTRIQKIHKLTQGKAFQEKYQEYNIKTFGNYAEDFQKNYKFKFAKTGKNAESQLQNQYWQIVNGVGTADPRHMDKFKATIQYAADLPAHRYGSGFPTFSTAKTSDQNFDYATSYFNLNNIYKSPSSVLSICDKNNQKISGITIPWVYMGMQFSSFCWHVEDLWLNSLNYSHKGATKTWYIIPESNKDAFDAYVLKKTGKRELLNSITFMIDPLQLIENGIKVYKAYQRPRQYILTLFNAYHAGFSQGYNVGEAVNITTIDSLEIIKRAFKANLLQKNHKAPVICYEWLVGANLNNPSINKQFIKSQYSKIVGSEFSNVKKIVEKYQIAQIEWIQASQKYDKASCYTCRYYQYFSLIKCSGCDKKFCLDHANKCCGKPLIFISRQYDDVRKKTIELVTQRIQ